MYDKLLSYIIGQSNSYLTKYAQKNNINRMLGLVVHSKDNLVIIKVKDFLFFLENNSGQSFKKGMNVKLNFLKDSTDTSSDFSLKMKYLGELSKNGFKVSFKLPGNLTSYINVDFPKLSESNKLRLSIWLSDFSHTFNTQLKNLGKTDFSTQDINSLKIFSEKIIKILSNFFKDNLTSVPSPTETASKLVDLLKVYMNKEKIPELFSKDEIDILKEKLDFLKNDENVLVKSLFKEEDKGLQEKSILNKNLNSYLIIRNLSLESKSPLMFFSVFGLPVFLQIQREFKETSKGSLVEDNSQKLNFILLTNYFGVLDINLTLLKKEMFIKFDIERNDEVFKFKTNELINLLSNKGYSIGRIEFL